ncbi:MAG: DNA polymerase III subunit alpha [Planctomycetaceae bacterium]|nr:DNA polymerase III subunit alpha [Planctomycetaceae bacterium]
MLAVDVGIHHAAAERAGAVQRRAGDDVADVVRPHPLQQLADAVRLELEHPLGVAALQQLVRLRVVDRQLVDVDRLAPRLLDQPHRVVQQRQRAQAEEVHLQQADLLQVAHHPLRRHHRLAAAGAVGALAHGPVQRVLNKSEDNGNKDNAVITTQWVMGDLEKVGMLKIDFLGLRTLTLLDNCVRLIKQTRGITVDVQNLPLDDPETYALLQRGDARGVFQFESDGIRELLKRLRPDNIRDIIACTALYRPGPLEGGMVDEYVECKHGERKPTYLHPVMKEVLEETYGVMVYQEQVMRILNRLGGIELSQAYACIKAISKKKTEVIAQGRKQFIDGAIGRGLDQETATKIFDLIEFFGGYGFNKSHSTAYALVLFQTAYLKAHYPTEFMAALLSSEMDGAEREKFFVEHIDDCRKMGVEVLPPNINEGEASFKVASEGKIHFGLAAIKGVGLKAIDAIVAARAEGGPFTGLDDLFERVPLGIVSQACVEALIKAGAFDALGGKRSQWLVVLPRAAQAGQAVQEDRKRGQLGLFDALERPSDGNGKGKRNGHIGDGNGPPAAPASLPDIPELHEVERLAEEKKVLGFYMSSHPLTRHAGLLQALATHQAADLAGVSDKAEVILGGMIVNVTVRNVQKSRSGLTRMAKFTFEDLSGTVPAMLWPEEYAKNEELVKSDQIVFAKGTLDRRRDPAELIVSRIIPLARGPAELSRGVVVRLSKGQHQIDDLQKLLRQVRIRPGNLDVYLEIVGLAGIRRAIYKAGAALKVCHDDRLLSDLEGAVGPGNVRLLGQRGATARVESTPPVTSHPAADPADSPLDDADDL